MFGYRLSSVTPPVPMMEPEKLPWALVRVSVCAPSWTLPLPERDWMEVPPVADMSSTPLSETV